jgi:hypothetical protein
LFGHSSAARATPDAIIGAASAPPDRMSARRRGRITFFIVETSTEPFLGRGVYRSGVCVQQRNAGKNAARRNVSPPTELTKNGIEARLAERR